MGSEAVDEIVCRSARPMGGDQSILRPTHGSWILTSLPTSAIHYSSAETQPGLWARQQPTDHPAKQIGMTHVAMFDVQQCARTSLPTRAGAAPGCGGRLEGRRGYDGRRHSAGQRSPQTERNRGRAHRLAATFPTMPPGHTETIGVAGRHHVATGGNGGARTMRISVLVSRPRNNGFRLVAVQDFVPWAASAVACEAPEARTGLRCDRHAEAAGSTSTHGSAIVDLSWPSTPVRNDAGRNEPIIGAFVKRRSAPT